MNASEILYDVGEVLGSTGNVKTVFGEPIHTEGKTVVPVAKIAYGFGGGFGEGRHPHHEASDKPGENTHPDGAKAVAEAAECASSRPGRWRSPPPAPASSPFTMSAG